MVIALKTGFKLLEFEAEFRGDQLHRLGLDHDAVEEFAVDFSQAGEIRCWRRRPDAGKASEIGLEEFHPGRRRRGSAA